MKWRRRLGTIFDYALSAGALGAGVLVVFIMLSVSADAVMRYFLNRPTIWVGEVTGYCLVFITFLSTAWVLKKNGHIRMDILCNMLNPQNRRLLNVSTSLICAIVCLVLVWYSGKIAWYYLQTGIAYPTELKTPRFIISAIVPVGSLLLFIEFLRRARGYLRTLSTRD